MPQFFSLKRRIVIVVPEYCYGFSDYITESCACNKEFVNHPSTDEDGRVVPKGVIEECKPCYKSIGSSIFYLELCPANSSSLQGSNMYT